MSRILVRAPNWLGDLVMALPAVASVRRHFARDSLIVAVPPPLAPLCELVPGVDEVLALDAGGSVGPWARARVHAAVMAAGRFDVAILLPGSFGSALAVRWAGIPERWGYRAGLRGVLLTRRVARPRRRSRLHHPEYYQALVRGLGLPTGALEARLDVPAADRARGRELLEAHGWRPEERLVALAPGAAYGHAKRWPPDRFARLAARLASERGLATVLVGGAGDRDAGAAIESALAASGDAARPIDLIGRTDLRRLAGVLAWCGAAVSNDSGALHLAAAVGVPVTAIFGPTDERVTRPIGRHRVLAHDVWCRPCGLRECPIDHRCMKGIGPDMVFDAVLDDLGLAEQGR